MRKFVAMSWFSESGGLCDQHPPSYMDVCQYSLQYKEDKERRRVCRNSDSGIGHFRVSYTTLYIRRARNICASLFPMVQRVVHGTQTMEYNQHHHYIQSIHPYDHHHICSGFAKSARRYHLHDQLSVFDRSVRWASRNEHNDLTVNLSRADSIIGRGRTHIQVYAGRSSCMVSINGIFSCSSSPCSTLN